MNALWHSPGMNAIKASTGACAMGVLKFLHTFRPAGATLLSIRVYYFRDGLA